MSEPHANVRARFQVCPCGIHQEIVRHGSNRTVQEAKALVIEKVCAAPSSIMFQFVITLFIEGAIQLKLHENLLRMQQDLDKARKSTFDAGLKKIATFSIHAMWVLETRRRLVRCSCRVDGLWEYGERRGRRQVAPPRTWRGCRFGCSARTFGTANSKNNAMPASRGTRSITGRKHFRVLLCVRYSLTLPIPCSDTA